MRGVFVTGTDTGCGKTHVAAALITALRKSGLRVTAFKPVAAGAVYCEGKLRNDDALALRAATGLGLRYGAVNPYCFEAPIAPHLAAAEAGVRIDPTAVVTALDDLEKTGDFVVAEGAGGWRVPLAPGLDIQALALTLRLPVVLVVGLRLGCLNHALLTEQAIRASGAPLLGWIGTQIDPAMQRMRENLQTLLALLHGPCLGILTHPGAAAVADCARPLVIDALLRPRRSDGYTPSTES
ncbi:MAG: dethiobiotin synthase [Sedimenticolaceae bacterium]